jgi:hypothetical protein
MLNNSPIDIGMFQAQNNTHLFLTLYALHQQQSTENPRVRFDYNFSAKPKTHVLLFSFAGI